MKFSRSNPKSAKLGLFRDKATPVILAVGLVVFGGGISLAQDSVFSGTSPGWGLFCALSGCTMTGGAVYSGVATDISAASGEDLTLGVSGGGKIAHVATAQASTAENIARFSVSDSSSSLDIKNIASGDAQFIPGFDAIKVDGTSSDPAFQGIGEVSAGLDTGTAAVWIFDGRRTGAAALTARSVARFSNLNGSPVDVTFNGAIKPTLYASQSACASATGTCSAAPVGSVSIAAAATTVTVSTTAVTANSIIVLTEDSTRGTALSVTCNTTTGRTYSVTTKTAGTSFVITASAAPVTNPACLNYEIIN